MKTNIHAAHEQKWRHHQERLSVLSTTSDSLCNGTHFAVKLHPFEIICVDEMEHELFPWLHHKRFRQFENDTPSVQKNLSNEPIITKSNSPSVLYVSASNRDSRIAGDRNQRTVATGRQMGDESDRNRGRSPCGKKKLEPILCLVIIGSRNRPANNGGRNFVAILAIMSTNIERHIRSHLT